MSHLGARMPSPRDARPLLGLGDIPAMRRIDCSRDSQMSVSESFMRAPEVAGTLPVRLRTDNGWITQSDYPTAWAARVIAQLKTAGPGPPPPIDDGAAHEGRECRRAAGCDRDVAPAQRALEATLAGPCTRSPWRRRAASRARCSRRPRPARPRCRRHAPHAPRAAAARCRRRRPRRNRRPPRPRPLSARSSRRPARGTAAGRRRSGSAPRDAERLERPARRQPAEQEVPPAGCGHALGERRLGRVQPEAAQLGRTGDAEREPDISRRREICVHALHQAIRTRRPANFRPRSDRAYARAAHRPAVLGISEMEKGLQPTLAPIRPTTIARHLPRTGLLDWLEQPTTDRGLHFAVRRRQLELLGLPAARPAGGRGGREDRSRAHP